MKMKLGSSVNPSREVGISEVICKDSPTLSGLISNPEAPTMTFLVVCYAKTYAGRDLRRRK
jgi:hypothetical protein